MVKMDEAVLAKLKKNTHNFEIYVDPYMAWDYRHGKEVTNFDDMIALDTVYSDAKKGDEASKEIIEKTFGTSDFKTIADEIIKEGEVQLTTAQRQEMTERREKEIIDFLSKNAHDPKTMTPIPPQRLINAFEELKIKINLAKRKEDEIKEILQKLQRMMPISMDKIIVVIEIPAMYSGKASPVIYKQEIVDQKWTASGNMILKIKIPAGEKANLISELNQVTHGDIKVSIEES
jgi:ribosome maturation protein SDO1